MSSVCHAENERVIRALGRDIAVSPILGLLLRGCAAAIDRTAPGARLYLVGGYPRDRAIESVHRVVRSRGDLDLLVTGLGAAAWGALSGALEREFYGTGIAVHPDIGRSFPVIKITRPGLFVDLAPARRRGAVGADAGVTLAADLARRDFTIDALAVEIRPGGDPPLGSLLDPHDGLADVRRGLVAAVGSPAECLGDDPARLYRAVRLETELSGVGFRLDGRLAAEVRRCAAELAPSIARERVVAEVERALRADAGFAFQRLDDLGLLDPIGLPGGTDHGGARARAEAAVMIARLDGRSISRSVLWGIVLHAGGMTGRETARRLRVPRHSAMVAARLAELRDGATGGDPDPAWLDRILTHRLTGPEGVAVAALFGEAPLDPDGRLARARERSRDAVLGEHLEDARRVALAVAGGMPRRLALPALRRRLLRLLRSDPARWVAAWTKADLLAPLLPELQAMHGVPQPPEFHAEGDVLRHTVLALEALAEHHPDASDRLVLAVLLHDAGKPETLRMPEETGDRIRFHGHDRAGAVLAEALALDLGLDEADAGDVHWLVLHHLAFFDALASMRPARAARVFRHRRFLELLRLHHCDCLASLRPDGPGDLSSPRLAILRYGDYLADRAQQLQEKAGWDRLRAAGIDGWTLRERLPLTDGPAVGRCLAALRSALDDDPGLDDEQLWEIARAFTDAEGE